MTRKQDSARGRITAEDLKKFLAEDRDLLKTIVEETLQQVLEAEMDEALQASKGVWVVKTRSGMLLLLRGCAGHLGSSIRRRFGAR